jgi:S-DNA-T family DNA segregation ATPase FtsK/SpoIIIE
VSYDPDAVKTETVDERIYKINDLGQLDPAYDPGEKTAQGQDTSDLPTQLEAVIEAVNKVYAASHLTLPAKPWLPNLEDRMPTPAVKATKALNTKIPLGLLDIPSEQAQKPYVFDLQEAAIR